MRSAGWLRVIFAIGIGFASLAQAAPAHAATRMVSPGPGTPLQDAINAAEPGDTLILKTPAIFHEAIVIDKRLTMAAASGNANIIPPCGSGTGITIAASRVKLRHLIVYGTASTAISIHGQHDVQLTSLHLHPNDLTEPCAQDGEIGINVDNSEKVRVNQISAYDSTGVGNFTTAFVHIADVGVDANVNVTNVFTNLDNPVGVLIEHSTDAGRQLWQGRPGIRLQSNDIVSSATSVRIVDSDGVQLINNHFYTASNVGVVDRREFVRDSCAFEWVQRQRDQRRRPGSARLLPSEPVRHGPRAIELLATHGERIRTG